VKTDSTDLEMLNIFLHLYQTKSYNFTFVKHYYAILDVKTQG